MSALCLVKPPHASDSNSTGFLAALLKMAPPKNTPLPNVVGCRYGASAWIAF